MGKHSQDDSTATRRARIGGIRDGRQAAELVGQIGKAVDTVEGAAIERAADRAKAATDTEWPPPTE